MNNRTYDSALLESARVAGWTVKSVDPIVPHPSSFERFRDQFIKLHIWAMEEFHEVVYMDLDTVFVAPLRGHFISLTAYPTPCQIWAARDYFAGKWVDGFNMGVVGIRPAKKEYQRLLDLLMTDSVKYDHVQSEQGFLNAVYTAKNGAWCEMEFEKNANLAVYRDYRPFWDSAEPQIIHFTLSKPWTCEDQFRSICGLWDIERVAYVMPITVVSAFFEGPNKHGIDNYKQWGPWFLQSQVPLVIFTDNEQFAALDAIKSRNTSITRVVVINKKTFLTSQKMFGDWSSQLAIDPEKNIHGEHLFKVWLEKTHLVMKAIQLNPYSSSHFVWVDFGCFRTPFWGSNWTVHVERLPGHQMLLLNSPTAHPTKHIAAPIFAGSILAWTLWSHHYYITVARKYREGVFIGDDQVVMSMVAERHPRIVCRINHQTGFGDLWFFLQYYLAGRAPVQKCF